MDYVYSFINELCLNEKYIVVAVSGGPDSMLLLDTILSLRDKLKYKIVVAHVHHNLRKESDDEAIDVENYCKKNNIIFEMKKLNKYPNNKFSEEAARRLRYDFFDEVMRKYKANILFTAHHGDDLIETILMRISRGATLSGYAGFDLINSDRGYKIAKPLMFLNKEEIEKLLKEKSIKFAIDKTNQSDKYTRNRYRKYILPVLKKENENIHVKYREFSKKILLADSYIKKQVIKIYNDIVDNNCINILKFNNLEEIIKIYTIEKYLYDIYCNDIVNINDSHVNIIIDSIKNKINSKISLPINKIGIIEYGYFKIVDNNLFEEYEYTFYDRIDLPNNYSIVIDNSTKLTSNFVIHLNKNDIKLPFHVRNSRRGDRMHIKNMNGTKKIGDIFTDFKLSKESRANYPIVTDDKGEIIWIPGIKKSYLDRKKDGKYDIILKYGLKEEYNEQKNS